MGTNFYAQRWPARARMRTHLGKASAGWKFLLKADPTWPREEALTHWLNLVVINDIVDEYGDFYSTTDFLLQVFQSQNDHSQREYDPAFCGPHEDLWNLTVRDHHWTLHNFEFTDVEFS